MSESKTQTPPRPVAPTMADIERAQELLKPILKRTDLLESEGLNRRVGGRLLFKPETLQPTGSFKIRGAWNHISRMTADERQGGVLALSAGNHALAVAWACKRLGVARAVILMPDNAPRTKVERTRSLGATVEFFDPDTVDYSALVSGWIAREKLHFVHPFEDQNIIAGAATAAVEMVVEAKLSGTTFDAMTVACSGGGLLAGTALTLEAMSPQTRLYGIEPEAYDDTARSFAAGERVSVPQSGKTICDTLTAPIPGKLTFSINQPRLAGVMSGSDQAATRGMRAIYEEFGLVTEPSAALALGILLDQPEFTRDRTIGVILCGRNVDPELFGQCISSLN